MRLYIPMGLCLFILAICGCNGLDMRSQSPDETLNVEEGPHTKLVGELAVPTGMEPVRIEDIGLVTKLHGTGSDPSPSPQRAALLDEMKKRGVENPNRVLASGNVSLVMVRGWLKAGIQEGDRFDVEVRTLAHSETTSLRGGYLLQTRLKEMAILGNQIHNGHTQGLCEGAVLVDPAAGPDDRVLRCRGRVLGGGVSLVSRPIGLVLTPGNQSARYSTQVANAVNKRFHTYRKGLKTVMATAKTKEYIELCVHPRYKNNLPRYVRVVRALPIRESASEQMQRISSLKKLMLTDPSSAAEAAIQLEAIGSAGEKALLEAIQAENVETRFYAAEALAYLDRREAAKPLTEIARSQPAFRVFALSALSVMTDYIAYDKLCELLSEPSAETRYGAFRALWTMNDQAPLVRGENIDDQFHYHVLEVGGPPMIHVTRNRLPEIVIFGSEQRLLTPLAINAGNEIMITCHGGDEITVSKFTVRDGDQKRIVSTSVDEVVRAVVELGGTYPDVVQALQEAKNSQALPARFEVDALPEAGRTFDRDLAANDAADENTNHQKEGGESDDSGPNKSSPDDNSDEKSNTKKSFFAKIIGK